MNLAELQNDPFFVKFVQKTARMLGEWYQQKALSMTTEELYADSEFFPAYNPERDYSSKPDGYTCRAEDGTMMRLTRLTSAASGQVSAKGGLTSGTTGIKSEAVSDVQASDFSWKCCWSTNPVYAKDFVSSMDSPYGKDECCMYDGVVYRSLRDGNTTSPINAPESWTRVDEFA